MRCAGAGRGRGSRKRVALAIAMDAGFAVPVRPDVMRDDGVFVESLFRAGLHPPKDTPPKTPPKLPPVAA